MSTPSSTINICSGVRLSNDYIHTIYFDSLSDQLTYFGGKVVKTFSHYTFLRKSWDINVESTMEQARKWSYLYFTNGSNSKTYFYFITNIEYVNDSTVKLSLELDVMQTYMFDYSLQPCFVEREHASSDAIGDNVTEETLNVGDLRVIDSTDVSLSEYCVLILSTVDLVAPGETYNNRWLASKYNNVFSGLGIFAVDATNTSFLNDMANKLQVMNNANASECIVAMWMYPKSLVQLADEESWSNASVCHYVKGATSIFKEVGRNTKTSGSYTPKNKKLLTYPYNFLYVTNNSGGAGVYRYERFGDPSACNFKIVGSLSPDGATKLYPMNYNGQQHNYEEGLTLSGFPSCAWNDDVYKLWLAQNQNQQNLSMLTAGLTIAGGVVATGASVVTGNVPTALGGIGAITHGATSIASTLAQRADKAVQPPQSKGQHSGSVNVAAGFQTFTIQRKSIGVEYARIIDDYFTMYGYQTNRVKVPARRVRENFTYTKTVNCHVTGNLCTEDLLKIQSIYDNGITFWVLGDSIGDYTKTNLPMNWGE